MEGTNTMRTYRKKPVVVEAVQWMGELHTPLSELKHWGLEADLGEYSALMIPTKKGVMKASVGDWIIKGVAGEFYPCKPEIFAATYEEVDLSYARHQ